MIETLKQGFLKLIFGLSLISFFYLLVFTVLGRAWMPLDKYERIFFLSSNLYTLVVFAILLASLFCVKPLLTRISDRQLFFLLTAVYLILGVFLISHADSMIRSDAKSVFEAAVKFNQGDYSSLEKGNYLSQYPHQLGLVTYERILMKFSEKTKFFFFINLCCVLGINFFQWRTIKAVIQEELTVKYTILMSFLFVPQFFFILFLYGLIPGMLCLTISIWGLTQFFKTKKVHYLLVNLLFITLASLLKNNFLIGAIAMGLVYLLVALNQKSIKLLCCSLLPLIFASSASSMITNYYEETSHISLNHEMPKVLYLVMGLQDDLETTTLGGWWNSYHEKTHAAADYDPGLSTEQGQIDLKLRVNYLARHLSYAVHFFHEKVRSSWTEPMFQSVWTGPLEDTGQSMKGEFFKKNLSWTRDVFCFELHDASLFRDNLWLCSACGSKYAEKDTLF